MNGVIHLSHLGGTRNPMVIHWPQRVTGNGELRSQFTYVTEIVPTILDSAGIPVPTSVDGIDQEPMHGVTFTGTLADPAAPERHTQQYFETIGNRAMYKDGWWLAMRTPRIPWVITPEALKAYAPGVSGLLTLSTGYEVSQARRPGSFCCFPAYRSMSPHPKQ